MALERSLWRCVRCRINAKHFSTITPARLDTTTASTADPEPLPPPPTPASKLDPYTVASPRAERRLVAQTGKVPIGSRRRRAAMAQTTQVPFTQLPYQCFQEAREFLRQDREEKLEAIKVQRERISRLQDKVVIDGREKWMHENRIKSMQKRLEELKILADINDPLVKKRFEDGQGDLNKPIYRHLSNIQWRNTKRPLLMQRITQMNIVPDILPAIDPLVSTELTFPSTSPFLSTDTGRIRQKRISHGEIVPSILSEQPPTLYIQPYDRGERLYTIALVNPDVPDVAKDGFAYRCHFLATNIPITPTDTRVQFAALSPDTQTVLPWLPAYAQKGLPYQRMGIFVLQQPSHLEIDQIRADERYGKREGFNLRSFVDRFGLSPVGVDLFRTVWDESTEGVMKRGGVVGADVEFKRKRVEPLPYKRKGGERYR